MKIEIIEKVGSIQKQTIYTFESDKESDMFVVREFCKEKDKPNEPLPEQV